MKQKQTLFIFRNDTAFSSDKIKTKMSLGAIEHSLFAMKVFLHNLDLSKINTVSFRDSSGKQLYYFKVKGWHYNNKNELWNSTTHKKVFSF